MANAAQQAILDRARNRLEGKLDDEEKKNVVTQRQQELLATAQARLGDKYQRKADKDSGSDFAAGVAGGIDSLQGTAYGLVGLAGDALERTIGVGEGLRDWGFKGYQDNMAEVDDEFRDAYTWDGATSSVGNFVDAGQYYVGRVIPDALAALGSGGLGSIAAKKVVSEGAETAIKNKTKDLLGDRIGDKVTKEGLGSVAGVATQSVTQSTGGIYGQAGEKAIAEGGTLEDVNLGKVVVGGLAAGAVETAADIATLGLAGFGAGRNLMDLANKGGKPRRVLTKGAIGSGVEAVTEGVQTGIEDLGAGESLADAKFMDPTSMLAGAFGGGAVGGVGGLRGKPTNQGTQFAGEEATRQAEEEVALRQQEEQEAQAAGLQAQQEKAEQARSRREAAASFTPRAAFVKARQAEITAQQEQELLDPNTELGQAFEEHLNEQAIYDEDDIKKSSKTFLKSFQKENDSTEQVNQEYVAALDNHVGKVAEAKEFIAQNPDVMDADEATFAAAAQQNPEVFGVINTMRAAAARTAAATATDTTTAEADVAPTEEATVEKPKKPTKKDQLRSMATEKLGETWEQDNPELSQLFSDGKGIYSRGKGKKSRFETMVDKIAAEQAAQQAPVDAEATADAIPTIETPTVETVADADAETTPVQAEEAVETPPVLEGMEARAVSYATDKLGPNWRTEQPQLVPVLDDKKYAGFQANVDRLAAERPAPTETAVVEPEQAPTETAVIEPEVVEAEQAPVAEAATAVDNLFAQPLPADVKLSTNEQKVFDVLNQAFQNNEQDQVVQSNGSLNPTRIAELAGLNSKQAAQTAITRLRPKIARAYNLDQKQIKQRLADTRVKNVEAFDVNATDEVFDNADLGDGSGTLASANQGARDGMAPEDAAFIDNMEETPIQQQTPEQLAAVRAELDTEVRAHRAYTPAKESWDNGFEGDVENEADRISFESMDSGSRFEWVEHFINFQSGDLDLDGLGKEYDDIRRLYIEDTKNAEREIAQQGRAVESQTDAERVGRDETEVREEGARPDADESQAEQNPEQLSAAEQTARAAKVQVVTKKKRRVVKPPMPEPKVEPRQATPEQINAADKVANDLGGEVVYQRGDVALVRGYGNKSGRPLYSVVKGTKYTPKDVEETTLRPVSDEQMAELIEVKQKAEAEAQRVHEETPFANYDQGLAFSENTSPELQGVVREWKDMLGIDADVYVTTKADAKADKNKFTGPLRAVGSGTLNANERGSTRRIADGTHYIIFDENASTAANLETLAHELGHIHQKEAFDQAPKEVQDQLYADHERWVNSQKGKTNPELVEALRARKSGKITEVFEGQLDPYWTSFSEYYADQTARWATTQDQPLTAVDNFFSRLGKAMRSFYEKLVNRKFLPSDTFKSYLDGVTASTKKDPLTDPMDEQSSAAQSTAGTQQKPKKSDYRDRGGRARTFVKDNFGDGVTQFYDDLNQVASTGANGVKFLHQIARDYKDRMPSIGRWYDAVLTAEKARNEIRMQVEGVARLARNMSEGDLDVANDFISKSTRFQKWGYDPGRPDKVKIDPVMAKAWARLNDDQQALVRGIFEHGENMRLRKLEIAKAAGVDSKFFSAAALEGPYAPLKRFGNFATELKSQQLLDAEKALNDDDNTANRKAVDDLKVDESHYVISFFDTMGQARRFADKNGSKYAFVDASEKAVDDSAEKQMPQEVLAKVLGGLNADASSGLDANARNAFEAMIKDMYFKSLDDSNARLSGAQRKNRAGYDKNMVRAFLSHARAEASLVASMENGAQINTELTNAANEAKQDRGELQKIYNLVARHYQDTLTTQDNFFTALQDRLTAANSVYMLTTSIGYHLTNATQTMIAAMELRGVFGSNWGTDGYSKAFGALFKGYKVSVAATSMAKNMEVDIDLENVPPQYRKLLEELQMRQLLDVGMEEDLSEFDRFRTGFGMVDATTDKLGTTVHKLYQVARFVEAHNRISTAVAAFDLAQKDPAAMKTKRMTPEEFAIATVEKTQGNFSRLDAPLLIKSLPKATTQFRKYQLTMAWIYAKGFDAAYRDKSISPEEKAMARRALHAQLTFAGVSAGAMGIPMVSTIAPYVLAFMTGEDEPQDLERWIRSNVEDEGLATLLSRGLPAFAGIDMSTKLSQGKIFHPLPYAEWELSPDGIENTFFQAAAGPLGTTLTNFGRAGQAAGRGDVLKAIEYSVPKGLRTAIESYRLGTEGYTMTNGDVVVDPREIDASALLMNALGIPSTQINNIKWTRGQQYELTKYFSEESGRIRREYIDAKNNKDRERAKELRDEFRDLQKQKKRVRPFFGKDRRALRTQPISDLMKSPYQQTAREKRAAKRFE